VNEEVKEKPFSKLMALSNTGVQMRSLCLALSQTNPAATKNKRAITVNAIVENCIPLDDGDIIGWSVVKTFIRRIVV
jgi:rRNA maturation protein Rpf1